MIARRYGVPPSMLVAPASHIGGPLHAPACPHPLLGATSSRRPNSAYSVFTLADTFTMICADSLPHARAKLNVLRRNHTSCGRWVRGGTLSCSTRVCGEARALTREMCKGRILCAAPKALAPDTGTQKCVGSRRLANHISHCGDIFKYGVIPVLRTRLAADTPRWTIPVGALCLYGIDGTR